MPPARKKTEIIAFQPRPPKGSVRTENLLSEVFYDTLKRDLQAVIDMHMGCLSGESQTTAEKYAALLARLRHEQGENPIAEMDQEPDIDNLYILASSGRYAEASNMVDQFSCAAKKQLPRSNSQTYTIAKALARAHDTSDIMAAAIDQWLQDNGNQGELLMTASGCAMGDYSHELNWPERIIDDLGVKENITGESLRGMVEEELGYTLPNYMSTTPPKETGATVLKFVKA